MNESTRPSAGGGRGRTVPSRDPREIVTPYAFRIEPSLLGKPLASPWRRAAAMLVDLIVVGLLVLLKEISFTFFALLVAWVLFRLSRRGRRVRTTARRAFLRIGAIVFLVIAVGLLFVRTLQFGATIAEGPAAIDGTPPEAADMDWADMARGAGAFMTLRRAETPEEARASASRLAHRLEASGLPPTDVRDILEEAMAPVADSAWADEVLEATIAGLDTAGAGPGVVAAAAPDTAGAEGDTVPPAGATGETPVEPGAETASPEVLRLRADAEELDARLRETEEELARTRERLADTREELAASREELDETEEELEEAREAEGGISLVAFGRNLQRDLGLGIGWLGLYFTVVTAFSGGRTVGKRLLGIRVVRLNGHRIGVWHAFGRFGGYAASIVTGLLGFLEIFWDANRQCLQDKLASTVVIVDRGEPPYRRAERSRPPAEPDERPAHRRPAGGDRPEGRRGGSDT